MTNLTPTLPSPNLVPFVVAAAGHRDLRQQDTNELLAQTRTVLKQMRNRMPHTPLVLLNGLAEGADQLIAQAALLEGVSLVAALPMPVEIYKAQMPGEAQQKFDELLSQCIFRVQMPNEGRSEEQMRISEETRADCYEELALFLAQNSQALIALWDGKDSEKKGGTSRVVRYVSEGIQVESLSEEEPQPGIIYQIVTPRESGSIPLDALSLHLLIGKADGKDRNSKNRELVTLSRSQFDLLEQNIERFNRDAIQWPLQQDKYRLIPAREADRLPAFLQRLEVLHRQADALSIRANVLRTRFFSAILAAALGGTLTYAVHEDFFLASVVLWLALPVFIAVAAVVYKIAKAKRVEDRYLDARAFAEALRVQFFWEMAGVVKPVADYYLLRHRTEMDWIRSALRNVWLFRSAEPSSTILQPNLHAVLNHWILDQEHWYRAKAKRQKAAVKRRELLSRYAVWLVVIWSVLVPVSLLVHAPWGWLAVLQSVVRNEPWYGMAHFLLVLPALLVGAYSLWTEQAGYEEQAREYAQIGRFLSWQSKLLNTNLDNPTKACEILMATGIEALEENGRWLLLHRERPLQVISSP